ncbi:MAG: response regulator [Lachnospiraceae bacterium]|nr:response regulator [Lachnospiraceae bacterium]
MLGVVAAGLLLTLFRYIETRHRILIYAVLFYLANMLSQYYWTAYEIVIGDDPGISSVFAYLGWNIAFLILLILVRKLQGERERHFMSPMIFLLIPAAAFQFYLYIPFGGVLNSAYQVLMITLVGMVSLQSILWYIKNVKNDVPVPYAHIVTFFYVIFEFGMWTSSCFDYPNDIDIPYYIFMLLSDLTLLLLPIALRKNFRYEKNKTGNSGEEDRLHFLKAAYVICVSLCCLAGVFLGVWMRTKIEAGIAGLDAGNLYDLIAVMLFVISIVMVVFTALVLLALDFKHRSAENEALRRDKEVAERVSIAKTDFLAGMSHEIRTPINAMLGMNEMILRESDSEEITKYAHNLESAGRSLLAIINDILDLNKIESGKMDIRRAPYQMSSVLNDVCNMILFRAGEKNLSFRTDVEKTLPDGLIGDEIRVRQIMTNLLTNAVKYTQKGSVKLTVKYRPSEDHALDLIISVTDTGIGIRKEDIGKLFTRFERMDPDRNRNIEGTGLGLAITKRLLELMGGEIRVESVYGEGSTFTAVIPQDVYRDLPIGDFRERFEKSNRNEKKYRETFHAPDALVLAVDDTNVNLIVIENMLKKTGIRIDTAKSGAEAVEKAKDTKYDLILMDQRMPKMDGVEALALIRAQENGCNGETPVICLTADAVQGAKEHYIAEGFTDYLSKPVNGRSLEETLMKYLPSEKVKKISDDNNYTASHV